MARPPRSSSSSSEVSSTPERRGRKRGSPNTKPSAEKARRQTGKRADSGAKTGSGKDVDGGRKTGPGTGKGKGAGKHGKGPGAGKGKGYGKATDQSREKATEATTATAEEVAGPEALGKEEGGAPPPKRQKKDATGDGALQEEGWSETELAKELEAQMEEDSDTALEKELEAAMEAGDPTQEEDGHIADDSQDAQRPSQIMGDRDDDVDAQKMENVEETQKVSDSNGEAVDGIEAHGGKANQEQQEAEGGASSLLEGGGNAETQVDTPQGRQDAGGQNAEPVRVDFGDKGKAGEEEVIGKDGKQGRGGCDDAGEKKTWQPLAALGHLPPPKGQPNRRVKKKGPAGKEAAGDEVNKGQEGCQDARPEDADNRDDQSWNGEAEEKEDEDSEDASEGRKTKKEKLKGKERQKSILEITRSRVEKAKESAKKQVFKSQGIERPKAERLKRAAQAVKERDL